MGAKDYKLLGPLLEITTGLDPKLLVAYDYGSSFLAPKAPGGAGEPQRAIELVKYGIAQNPDQWKLYYELGFIYYMDLKDYAGAADAFTRGAELPNSHPFMKVLFHGGQGLTSHVVLLASVSGTWRRRALGPRRRAADAGRPKSPKSSPHHSGTHNVRGGRILSPARPPTGSVSRPSGHRS